MTMSMFFGLNITEGIAITLQDPIEWVGDTYEEDIILLIKDAKILLADGPIYWNIKQLSTCLKKVLKKGLMVHQSITQDIGYLCNEYHKNSRGFVEKDVNGCLLWIGYEYCLWEVSVNNKETTTWLYNDKDGNIVLEITPFYPYFFCDPVEEPNYVSYDAWIKSYAPYLVTKLSKEIAQQWLDQAENIIQIIENNEVQYQKKINNKENSR